MAWTEGQIDGVLVRPLAIREDRRGWLAELFRDDELPAGLRPAMAYVSMTRPGVQRGPHEHREQTDIFAFVGPGDYLLRLWDPRAGSATRGRMRTLTVGHRSPALVVVPPGVVHAYRNVSAGDAWVLNFPDRLYAGPGRQGQVDEIRHEDGPSNEFSLEP